ncbi:acid phosphatase 1-like [Melia azedarach]|uniref:Acid phosphatase 1-like n=1 Tax=Melia azedarach TaxID=155640 RepID=A0ACC1Y2R7_MELAZ|nr:acid phosphatase 1-like [Melia azedarach]
MGAVPFFVFLATFLIISVHGSGQHIPSLIRQPVDRSDPSSDISCLSWRLGVETNNIRDWITVPKKCEGDVELYMTGSQYLKDSKAVTDEAFTYAESLELAGDGKDIWVFDIDETSLSNLPFYALYGLGAEVINVTAYLEWQLKGELPALPESIKLYKRLMSLGIKVVFLTGRFGFLRNSTESNLKKAGYHTWEKLILRDSSSLNETQIEFKSGKRRELEETGYRIVGNIGDQWSDLLGVHPGNRTFKLPIPMYYIP